MSFGAMQDEWYRTFVVDISDTPEGRALLEKEAAERERRQILTEARTRRDNAFYDLIRAIQEHGSCPENCVPQGETLWDTMNIYGGGEMIIASDGLVWYVLNNGMDGDNWGRNNVMTGGAGAIGFECPREKVDALLDAWLACRREYECLNP